MSALNHMRADAFRHRGRYGTFEPLYVFLVSRTYRPILTLRICQLCSSKRGIFRLVSGGARLLHRWMCHSACMDLPWRTEIGPGFSIAHGWGLVVNQKVRIGCNVTIFHGATLGRSDRINADGTREIGYPVLDDDVWIGPNSIVVGRVKIGQGSRISGGAFVSKNVEPHSIVVGNPASIVKSNCLPDVMNPVPVERLSA